MSVIEDFIKSLSSTNKAKLIRLLEDVNTLLKDDSTKTTKPTKPTKPTKQKVKKSKAVPQADDSGIFVINKNKKTAIGKSTRRENKFLEMEFTDRENTEFQKAAEEDKKAWEGKSPKERDRQVRKVKVSCSTCNKQFEVSPSLVYKEPDGTIVYYCNKCGGKR